MRDNGLAKLLFAKTSHLISNGPRMCCGAREGKRERKRSARGTARCEPHSNVSSLRIMIFHAPRGLEPSSYSSPASSSSSSPSSFVYFCALRVCKNNLFASNSQEQWRISLTDKRIFYCDSQIIAVYE